MLGAFFRPRKSANATNQDVLKSKTKHIYFIILSALLETIVVKTKNKRTTPSRAKQCYIYGYVTVYILKFYNIINP